MKTVSHKRATLAIVLLGTFVAQSAWACKVPTSPRAIPDGRNADMELMMETKRKIEHYLENVSAYMNCENDGLKLQQVAATQTLVMDRFNAEIRAFNAQARAVKAVNRQ